MPTSRNFLTTSTSSKDICLGYGYERMRRMILWLVASLIILWVFLELVLLKFIHELVRIFMKSYYHIIEKDTRGCYLIVASAVRKAAECPVVQMNWLKETRSQETGWREMGGGGDGLLHSTHILGR